MRKPIVSTLMAAALLGGVAAPTLVAAQTATPPNAAAQAPASPEHRAEHRRPLPGTLIEARLAFLKTALKITPAQEKQWNAFANVMRRQARDMDAKIQQRRAARQSQGQTQAEPSAIERLERREQFFADAAARSKALLTAARPLYASFSPEQKQTADELFARRGGHRFHRG